MINRHLITIYHTEICRRSSFEIDRRNTLVEGELGDVIFGTRSEIRTIDFHYWTIPMMMLSCALSLPFCCQLNTVLSYCVSRGREEIKRHTRHVFSGIKFFFFFFSSSPPSGTDHFAVSSLYHPTHVRSSLLSSGYVNTRQWRHNNCELHFKSHFTI